MPIPIPRENQQNEIGAFEISKLILIIMGVSEDVLVEVLLKP